MQSYTSHKMRVTLYRGRHLILRRYTLFIHRNNTIPSIVFNICLMSCCLSVKFTIKDRGVIVTMPKNKKVVDLMVLQLCPLLLMWKANE